ncbi:MAG: response regulator [Phycisphaerales bacterium]|nr:MAG: response regulator [Phycisphaerales bacterium]
MYETIKPIDVLVGEARDGHAELVEASVRGSGIVNNLYRGRNGEETLALVRDAWRGCTDAIDAPSLILLDCGLPRVGGVDVLRVLRNDRRYSWIPIIMMTTAYSRQQAEQCRRLRCEAYLTKWTVFLGLPGFVSKVRVLANRAMRIASRRLSTSQIHGHCPVALDRHSMLDAAQIDRHEQERIAKEVNDASVAS